MTHDTEVAVLTPTIGVPSPEALEAGAPPVLELGIIAGLTLPVPNPQDPSQPLVIPAGKYKFNFTRQQAIELFTAALEAAETLPEQFTPSGKVMIASNMADVQQAADRINKVTGG